MGRVVLIGGGVRSGKSRFALRRAAELGVRRTFVATAETLDEEMAARVARHRAERDGSFETVEAPRDLLGALRASGDRDVVLVDCLTLWLGTLLVDGASDAEVEARMAALAGFLSAPPASVVLVTNEVGMGIVPEHPLGRRFRDLAGAAHQRLAAGADEVYLAAMGVVLRLVPGPVEVVR